MRNDNKYNPSNAPDTLNGHIFYGLNIDEHQKYFRDLIWSRENICVACNSKSGSGKSTIAVATANLLYEYGLYDSISYICFPCMEEKMGYLPGNKEEKLEPYMQPLKDALMAININPEYVIANQEDMEAMKRGDHYINFMSHVHLRGTNFSNQIVIVDEAQNSYFDELKKVLTRFHDNCKIILIGHTEQCDLFKHPEKSGFAIYLKAFEQYEKENPDDMRIKTCKLYKNYRGFFSAFADDVKFN